MKKTALVAIVIGLMSLATPAYAGLAEHTETCTEFTARLSGFPSRGVHTVTAYGLPGNPSKSFTGTGATLRFAVSMAPGESESVLYSWKGSQGGTKPGVVEFTCNG